MCTRVLTCVHMYVYIYICIYICTHIYKYPNCMYCTCDYLLTYLYIYIIESFFFGRPDLGQEPPLHIVAEEAPNEVPLEVFHAAEICASEDAMQRS